LAALLLLLTMMMMMAMALLTSLPPSIGPIARLHSPDRRG
jgi:hypothetical protein